MILLQASRHKEPKDQAPPNDRDKPQMQYRWPALDRKSGLVLRSAVALPSPFEGGPRLSRQVPFCPGPTTRPPRNDGV